jgi:hypothetical protein
LFQRSLAGSPACPAALLAIILIFAGGLLTGVANAKTSAKPPYPRTALGGFVKDTALAKVLGETLFRDTVDVMSALSIPVPAAQPDSSAPDQSRDNSAVGQVARTLLAHRSLDKYLWLIRQAYDDSLWRGGDRARIEQHFSLIWRTSIMLYESSLDASPTRVRVCTPDDSGDGFDCRDELERAKVVPIPSPMPNLGVQRQPNIA